jgi:hypothetical protein
VQSTPKEWEIIYAQNVEIGIVTIVLTIVMVNPFARDANMVNKIQ